MEKNFDRFTKEDLEIIQIALRAMYDVFDSTQPSGYIATIINNLLMKVESVLYDN